MIHNFGIYDGDGPVRSKKYYGYWARMIERCYSERELERNPTYKGTQVDSSWKYYTNFENWANKEFIVDEYVLDKDIIGGDAKIYSPETCCFIPQELNKCILDRKSDTVYPLGVWYKNKSKNMISERTNPYCAEIVTFGNSRKLGNFKTASDAHREWQREKIIYFHKLIQKYIFLKPEIIQGLKRRIEKLQHDYDNYIITETVNRI